MSKFNSNTYCFSVGRQDKKPYILGEHNSGKGFMGNDLADSKKLQQSMIFEGQVSFT